MRIAISLTLAFAVSGCETAQDYSLTYKLWGTEDFRKWSEPAPEPHLALYDAGTDMLVQYDALSERHSVVKRQAYYLYLNEERIAEGQRPRLEDPSVAQGMPTIPVLTSVTVLSNAPPSLQLYAVMSIEGRHFTLHRNGLPDEVFDFPVYSETAGTAVRVALTPFAVAGDVVMVGVVAAVVGFLLWVQSGAPH